MKSQCPESVVSQNGCCQAATFDFSFPHFIQGSQNFFERWGHPSLISAFLSKVEVDCYRVK